MAGYYLYIFFYTYTLKSSTKGNFFHILGDEKYDHFRATNTHQVETDKTVKSFRSNIMRRLEYQPSYHPTEVRKVVIKNYPKYNSDSSALIKTKL